MALLKGTTSSTVITHMKSIFARHGIPEIVISDNGPLFASKEFAEFAAKWEFSHITSSPRYPKANGMAERGVQTIKIFLEKADIHRDRTLLGRQKKDRLYDETDVIWFTQANILAKRIPKCRRISRCE